jgi:hypothetical protein
LDETTTNEGYDVDGNRDSDGGVKRRLKTVLISVDKAGTTMQREEKGVAGRRRRLMLC